MAVAVLSSTGKKLMPTSNYHARRLLKKGRAVIARYKPVFTIRMTDREDGETQPVEYTSDTGYIYVGISVKSQRHEFFHEERDMLSDETERHNDCRKYRKTRRNRKRYRKPRFDNRSKKDKELAPSIRHKMECQIRLFDQYCEVLPITTATFEMGKFDTSLMQAVAEGKAKPEGKDYQKGSRYLTKTLRAAVFSRDNYTCQICGKSGIKDHVVLHTHHIGFWKGYRSNRVGNLLTVCDKCHTAKNHKQDGKLWGLEPKGTDLAPAVYMNTVRWAMYRAVRDAHPEIEIHIQYGVQTDITRQDRNIEKSHANDAYCIGTMRPKHRCREVVYQKLKRHHRIRTKFYDAEYIDVRDGKIKSGAQLSCGRTKRKESRRSEKSERIYRGRKCRSGRNQIRREDCEIQAGDKVLFDGKIRIVKGSHRKGEKYNIEFKPDGLKPKSACLEKITPLHRKEGWGVSSHE